MPGTDGIDMVKTIRADGDNKLAIIMMTGYNWDDVEGEANEAGIDGFMPKPLFPDTVRRALSEVLAVKNPLAGEESAEPAGEQETVSVEGLRLMLAEDIEINAEILMELLTMEGIEAERAENGEAAVSMFAEHAEYYYDAILMDVRMPVMDGLTAAKVIRDMDRADAKTIPIIALTANAFEEDVQQSAQAGMNAHLSKPVEMDRLLETLRTLAVRRQPV
jgi:CheY-like chemotaxis protein